MAATQAKRQSQGKSSFVKEYLNDNPQSNPVAVNEAWATAGMKGTISPSLVNKVRSEMGLTGNLPRGKKPKGRKPGPAPRGSVPVPARNGTSGSRRLAEVEAGIDRLLFAVIGIGELSSVEEGLRATRRALYRHMNGNHA